MNINTLRARVPAVLKEDLRARESGSVGDLLGNSSLALSCPGRSCDPSAGATSADANPRTLAHNRELTSQ